MTPNLSTIPRYSVWAYFPEIITNISDIIAETSEKIAKALHVGTNCSRNHIAIIPAMEKSQPQATGPEADKPRPMALFGDNMERAQLTLLYRDIWRLAMPIMIGQGINAFIGFFQKIVLSHLGDKAFNSVNVGMMVFFIISRHFSLLL